MNSALNTLSNLTELQQVELSIKILAERNLKVFKEVPLFSSSIDMIAINNNNELSAIEFKLRNWKKAIDQVKKHSIAVDYMSICILKPKNKVTREKIEDVCKQEKTGLLYFYLDEKGNPEIFEAVKPIKSDFYWDVQKESLLNMLLEY
ncbi:hypothetical protein [Gracilibacillus suaedae]|uniref:hypothetical protein n=1 Tax=Gracilibacillus suaedae TaxID=2820273 RepID=UPI001ABDF342|nr:hypothetical protein [Gracilibacillus suaedae]